MNPRERWALLLILAAAIAIRLGSAAALPCISRDGVFFVEFARQIAADPVAAMRGQTKQPGYSLLLLATDAALGGADGVLRDGIMPGENGRFGLLGFGLSDSELNAAAQCAVVWERCGQAISIFGGIAGVGLLFLVTRRLFDGKTGLIAAGLAAVWPQHVELSADVLSDAPHLALYLGCLLLGLRALRTTAGGRGRLGGGNALPSDDVSKVSAVGPAWGFLCGICGGAAYWLRQEALGIIAACVICLLWSGWRRLRDTSSSNNESPIRKTALAAASIVAGFVVSVAPYSLIVGRVMPNKSLDDLLFGPDEPASAQRPFDPFAGHTVRAPEPSRAGPVTWWDGPGRMAAGWARSGGYVLSTFALLGFFWRRSRSSDPAARQLVVAAAVLQLSAAELRGLSYGVISDRYILVPAALCIPWSATGMRSLAEWIAEWIGAASTRKGNVRIFTVVAAVAVGLMAYRVVRTHRGGHFSLREAGTWLAAHAEPTDVLLAPRQLGPLSFYAGTRRWWPAGDSIEALRREVGIAAPRWFADAAAQSGLTESERGLLSEMRRGVAELTPVYEDRPGDAGQLRLFDLRSALIWSETVGPRRRDGSAESG